MKPFKYNYGVLSINKLLNTPPPSLSNSNVWVDELWKWQRIMFKTSGDKSYKNWNITSLNLINLHYENAFN